MPRFIRKIVVCKATRADFDAIERLPEWQDDEYREAVQYLCWQVDFNPLCDVAKEVVLPHPAGGSESESDEMEADESSAGSGGDARAGERAGEREGERIVGFVMAKTERNLLACMGGGKVSGHITNIVVLRTHRRRGVGRKLLLGMHARLQTSKVDFISLHVRENNETAIRLYNSLNYHEVKRIPKYYRNGDTAIRMEMRFNQ